MTGKESLWNRLARVCVIFIMIALCAVARLNAQGYGTISGTVADAHGDVIPGATVVATQTQSGTQMTAITSKDGLFVFPSLLPAGYTISVSKTGFESYSQLGIVLEADQALTVNIKLMIGVQTTTVTVTADAPQVDTTTGTLSQVVDEASIADLPLNGRNTASLITLVAGVANATNEGNGADQGIGKTFPAAVVTTANGTSPQQNNYLLDGGNNVDEMTNVNGPFPFPDATQEFSVQTSNYNAEFGQSAGAMVNIVTKSGGEVFHGDAFDFERNGYFDAKPYFATVADNLHRHQYGGTIGGPVIIPHFSTGRATQFFFGYQHTIIHQNSNSNIMTVPTLAEEGRGSNPYADFGNLCAPPNAFNGKGICSAAGGTGAAVPSQQISDVFTGVAYPFNQIPASNFDPAAVILEKLFPTVAADSGPGKIGGNVNYFKPTIQSYNEFVSRVDHQFSERDHLFGHYYSNYFLQAGIYDPGNLTTYSSYYNTRYQNALLSETHTFTSNLLNSLVVNYQREVSLRGGPPGSSDITSFGVTNLWQPNTGPYMTFSASGYIGESGAAFAGWLRNNYTYNDDLHWVRGKHNIAFGGHFEMSKFDVANDFQSYGSFTSGLSGTSFAIGNVNAMANFQQGFLTGFNQGNFELVKDRNHFPGLYAQDSWKISPKLTLDYGVRWEDFVPWHNLNGNEQEFQPGAYVAGTHATLFSTLPAGLLLSGNNGPGGDPGIPQWGLNAKYLQFMPRGGFAYDLFGTGKTVVRGGGGIFYQDRMPGFFNLNQSSDVPNTIAISTTNALGTVANPGGPLSNPYCTGGCLPYGPGGADLGSPLANPFPFTLPFPSTKVFPTPVFVAEYDPSGNFHVPVTYDYNLTIEHQIAATWSTRIAYVGSGSRHQFINLEVNPAVNTGYMTVVKGTPTLTFPTGTSAANFRRAYNTAPTVGPCAATAGCNTSYSQIVEASMSGSAKYNSLQVTLEKKMSRGLSMLFNYTWSKSLDDLPQATRVGNQEDLNAGASYVYPVYPNNMTIPASVLANAPNAGWTPPDYKALDRGRSDIDKPMVLSYSYVYELPKLHNGYKAVKYVVNGWRTSGLVQHRSGDSLTAIMGTDNSATGLSQDRAQRDYTQPAYSSQNGGAGNCVPGKLCVNWFNSAAFSAPLNTGAGTGYGNV
ncbi:MAG TPA: carboxypeptidase regulatory-like domain-containing protein, partial [Terracidiphilus sp.]